MANDIDDEDYLPFEIDYFPKHILRQKAQDTTFTADQKENSLLQLKKLLQGHNSSKDVVFEEDLLNAYLMQNKYDERRAFKKLKNYLNFRTKHSYVYRSVNFDLGSHPSCRFATFLPRRLSDGSVMVLLEPGYWEPEELSFETAKQIFYLIFQQELRNPVTQASGFHVIHDTSNTGLRHYKYCTPYNAYLLNHAAFDVLPANFFGLHLINTNLIVSALLKLSQPFLPEFFRDKIYIHSSTEKLLEYFPRSVLPAKYGGSLEDYDCGMPNFLRKANEQHDDFPVGGQKNIF